MTGYHARVVGASRGIGAAVTRRLASDGATIVGVARDSTAVEAVINGLPGDGHRSVAVDLTTEAGQSAVMAALGDRGIDIVVTMLRHREPWTRLADSTPDSLARSAGDHVGYLAALAAGIIPEQRARGFGRWIAISSSVATTGGAGQGAYVAQKCALEGLMRTLAIEEGPAGITANTVSPGFVAHDGTRGAYPSEVFEALSSANALGRAGTVEEIAHVVSMLVQPLGGFVTGATIQVSGGAELGWAIGRAVREARDSARGRE